MIKKYLIMIMSFMCLVGCQPNEKTMVHFFYYEDCQNCHAMEDYLLSDDFFNEFDIVKHDLDLDESRKLYHEYMGDEKQEGKLKDVDMGYRMDCLGPLLIFDGYGAYLGYSADMNEQYLQDFQALLNKQPLLECFESTRFLER